MRWKQVHGDLSSLGTFNQSGLQFISTFFSHSILHHYLYHCDVLSKKHNMWHISTTLTKRQLHKAASSAELRNHGLNSIRPIHIERKWKKKQQFSLMFVIYFWSLLLVLWSVSLHSRFGLAWLTIYCMVRIFPYRSTAPLHMHMHTKEGCGLGPHMLPCRTLLLEPEWSIND